MPPWLDFAAIKQQVPLAEVLLGYYGLTNLKARGDKLIGPCPVHGGDNPRAFHANTRDDVWYCFTGCARGGDQLALVAVREGITTRQAAELLAAAYGIGNAAPRRSIQVAHPGARSDTKHQGSGKPRAYRLVPDVPLDGPATATKHTLANPPLKVTLNLDPTHPALKERRLTPGIIREFGVGYCRRGIMRGCLAIPIHDEHGVLVAYTGRRLLKKDVERWGKYTFPRGFHKQLVLFNLHRTDMNRPLILVEGFFSVMLLAQRGVSNVAAVMGCSLAEHQARLIAAKRPPAVTVLFDGNEAGRNGARRTAALLSTIQPALPVTVHALAEGLEPEDLAPAQLYEFTNRHHSPRGRCP